MITATCSHTFCNDCIIAALSVSPQCPVDRSPLTETELQPANPIVRSVRSTDFQVIGTFY